MPKAQIQFNLENIKKKIDSCDGLTKRLFIWWIVDELFRHWQAVFNSDKTTLYIDNELPRRYSYRLLSTEYIKKVARLLSGHNKWGGYTEATCIRRLWQGGFSYQNMLQRCNDLPDARNVKIVFRSNTPFYGEKEELSKSNYYLQYFYFHRVRDIYQKYLNNQQTTDAENMHFTITLSKILDWLVQIAIRNDFYDSRHFSLIIPIIQSEFSLTQSQMLGEPICNKIITQFINERHFHILFPSYQYISGRIAFYQRWKYNRPHNALTDEEYDCISSQILYPMDVIDAIDNSIGNVPTICYDKTNYKNGFMQQLIKNKDKQKAVITSSIIPQRVSPNIKYKHIQKNDEKADSIIPDNKLETIDDSRKMLIKQAEQ